jgi:type VI secretion system protein ImpK
MNDKTLQTPPLPNAFRDTALTVASLADDAAPISFAPFRGKCQAQVEALRRELASAGHSPDVIRDATYAQCALLDEAALLRLKGADRDAWETEPLQIKEFHTNDAGNELIGLIRRRLAEPRPKLVLLTLFSAVLGLGFKGKFAINGADGRLELMRALDQETGQSAPKDTSGTVLLTQGVVRQWNALNARMSSLGCVVLGVVIAGLVYLWLSQWLAASIARMSA